MDIVCGTQRKERRENIYIIDAVYIGIIKLYNVEMSYDVRYGPDIISWSDEGL